MPRALNEDYTDLLEFINNYSITDKYNKGLSDNIIKPIHKSYYSTLVLLAELNHQKAKPEVSCIGAVKAQRKLFWLHLSESFSELGSSFFLIINGCYKASDQVLRSSIENFIKALGSLDKTGLNQIKSVCEIFEKSGSSKFFSTDLGRQNHNKLSTLYSSLCSTVHTGDEKHMQKISSLGDFPAINIDRAKIAKKNYINIAKIYTSSLSAMFPQNFHKMHHRNRDIVQLSLSSTVLKDLHK